MQKVLTAAEMREVDRLTTEKYGIPSIVLMENSAHAVARIICERHGGSVKGKPILILCGQGNNGGDGAALARVLWQLGAVVDVVLFGKVEETKGDARINFDFLLRERTEFAEYVEVNEKLDCGRITFREHDDGEHFRKHFRPYLDPVVVVDAIFGTGLSRPVSENIAQVLVSEWFEEKFFRDRRFELISVDLPSGLCADSATPIGEHASADLTITFTAPKVANVLPPAAAANGELIIAHIGTPQILVNRTPTQTFVTETADVFAWMYSTQFRNASYKNKRGHALIIGGSENYSGAAVLCGNAAIRSGVGLVTIGTPRLSKDSVAGRVVPEVMVRPLAETDAGSVAEEAIEEIEAFLDSVDAIAIGSGLSAGHESTGRLVRHLVKNRTKPTILDADALSLLSPFNADEIKDERKPPLILTPHQGEFLKMLGTDDKDAIKDRVAAVREFAQEHHVILVLKGERVLTGEPGGKVVVNPTGNSGLGKAGNGDTLTGIIAGFAAQAAAMDVDMFETVVAAVYIAALAGDIAEKKYGKRVMTASDVRDCLGEAFETVSRPQSRQGQTIG